MDISLIKLTRYKWYPPVFISSLTDILLHIPCVPIYIKSAASNKTPNIVFIFYPLSRFESVRTVNGNNIINATQGNCANNIFRWESFLHLYEPWRLWLQCNYFTRRSTPTFPGHAKLALLTPFSQVKAHRPPRDVLTPRGEMMQLKVIPSCNFFLFAFKLASWHLSRCCFICS